MDNFIFLPDRSKKNAGNSASGKLSVALGQHCTASGDYSFADGSGCTASTTCSVALGNAADASGTCGFMYKDICDNTFCFDSGGQNGSGHIKINGNLVAGAGHLPVGYIMPFAGINPPDLQTGWMLCDGSQLAEAEYPKLFTAIGTTYTDAEVAGYFNVPDLRGRTIFGSLGSADATEDQRAGSAVVGFFVGDRKITSAYLPSHTHTPITFADVNYTPSHVTSGGFSNDGPVTHVHTFNLPSIVPNAHYISLATAIPDLQAAGYPFHMTGLYPNWTEAPAGGPGTTGTQTTGDQASYVNNNGYPWGYGGWGGWEADSFDPEILTATTQLTLVPTSSEPAKGEDYLPPTLVMNFIIRCK